jgi:hypothetical protein
MARAQLETGMANPACNYRCSVWLGTRVAPAQPHSTHEDRHPLFKAGGPARQQVYATAWDNDPDRRPAERPVFQVSSWYQIEGGVASKLLVDADAPT